MLASRPMLSVLLSLVVVGIAACGSTNDTATGNGDDGGAPTANVACDVSSFQQFYKCEGQWSDLGDQGSEVACLTACRLQSSARGCWYLDGSGGFPRDCRICTDMAPQKDFFSNDFAMPLPCGNDMTTVSGDGGTDGATMTTTTDGGCAYGPFQQFYKCEGAWTDLGDQGSEAACLTACEQHPTAAGCWYLDGTGGFPRDCRICTDTAPAKDVFSNDFAATPMCTH